MEGQQDEPLAGGDGHDLVQQGTRKHDGAPRPGTVHVGTVFEKPQVAARVSFRIQVYGYRVSAAFMEIVDKVPVCLEEPPSAES